MIPSFIWSFTPKRGQAASSSWALVATSASGDTREEQEKRDALKALFAGELDHDWYLEAYPDVARAGLDPLDDYLDYGEALGRNPNAEFRTALYLRRYPKSRQREFIPSRIG